VAPQDLLDRPFWIFDMDGTLTVPQHDFAAFKRRHGLPEDQDVLGTVATLPPDRQRALHQAIHDWELELAHAARAQEDALLLLEALAERGARCAVLTRNSLEGARITLDASGLAPWFPDPLFVLGRDCAAHKPAPDGIELLLSRWGAPAERAVMVGDWVFDVQAGRNAGTATVLVARHGPVPEGWRPFADAVVERLDGLLAA
jgi:phosphoglycolate phosphatase-like HAD superfamily hydrolase